MRFYTEILNYCSNSGKIARYCLKYVLMQPKCVCYSEIKTLKDRILREISVLKQLTDVKRVFSVYCNSIVIIFQECHPHA